MRKKSKGGLVGAIPWPVVGRVCNRLVSEPLVETSGWYGPGLLVKVSWSRSNSDREIENIKRNGVAEATHETERHRSFVRIQSIMTIPFEFERNRHYKIRRDTRSLDRRIGEQGSSYKKEARLRSWPLDPIGERDQRPTGNVGNRVAWELISQGDPTIQTIVSPRV